MSQKPANLLVLLSGSGRTLVNLARTIERGDLSARITGVVASRECVGIARAGELNLSCLLAPGELDADRLDRLAAHHDADWVVLAGYLKLIRIPPRLQGRVVNIHPALLPAFGGPGMFGHHVHQAVIDAGITESGCTVHLCDDRYDTGPIVLQQRCPVLPGDTPDTLAARVFECECQAYPKALQYLITHSESTSVNQHDQEAQ